MHRRIREFDEVRLQEPVTEEVREQILRGLFEKTITVDARRRILDKCLKDVPLPTQEEIVESWEDGDIDEYYAPWEKVTIQIPELLMGHSIRLNVGFETVLHEVGSDLLEDPEFTPHIEDAREHLQLLDVLGDETSTLEVERVAKEMNIEPHKAVYWIIYNEWPPIYNKLEERLGGKQ